MSGRGGGGGQIGVGRVGSWSEIAREAEGVRARWRSRAYPRRIARRRPRPRRSRRRRARRASRRREAPWRHPGGGTTTRRRVRNATRKVPPLARRSPSSRRRAARGGSRRVRDFFSRDKMVSQQPTRSARVPRASRRVAPTLFPARAFVPRFARRNLRALAARHHRPGKGALVPSLSEGIIE